MDNGERGTSSLRIIGRTIGALIVISAVATNIYAYHLNFVNPRTDDAAVRANVVGITPEVNGPIVDLRVTTLGELMASIAHEVNQPLAAIVTNGNACVRWLAGDPPNLEEVRQAVGRMIRDGHRASDVIQRIRALVQHTPPQQDWLDVNDMIQEVIALTRSEVHRQRISLQTQLAADLPRVRGDRVQLQQVLLNLLMNGIEALSGVNDRARELRISSGTHASHGMVVTVQDSGIGIDPEHVDRLFNAFFTTKPSGMGLGLAISRSIIEAHDGRLWASPNAGPGATFQFILPLPSAHQT
jgi:signal transduction histidine kinase